jgi:hypothetical protein
MKTIFDPAIRDELTTRVKALDENNKALWGKMNVFQMTRHCSIWNEWVLGKNEISSEQGFLGKLFGQMALRSNTKDDKPLGKNTPTGKAFTVKKKEGDLNAEKKILINLIADFEHFSDDQFMHDFFGKMSREQIGILAYKHSDHHLRQFNV